MLHRPPPLTNPWLIKFSGPTLFVQQNQQINLPACTNLGQSIESSGVILSWNDPSSVILNQSTLAEWYQTDLVAKSTGYPEHHDDGQIIASTCLSAGTKNQYSNGISIPLSTNETKYFQLFSKPTYGTWNNLDANKFLTTTGYNWQLIRNFVKAGRGPQLFPVGTIFTVHHDEYIYADGSDLKFRVVGHNQVPAADQAIRYTMCLDMVDILFNSQYDAPELLYALTEDTTFQAAKTYYTLSGTTYAAATADTDYIVGDEIPLLTYYQKNVDTNRSNYGSNQAQNSNLLQWANSDGLKNTWFQKKTLFDKCTSYLISKNGFMRYLDQNFKSVLINAQLSTAKSNIDGGGSISHTAKMFPLSITQVFGNYNNGYQENKQLEYYSSAERRKKTIMDASTSSYWWLRSPLVGYSYSASTA